MTRALLGTAPAGATNAVRWQDLLAQNTATMPTNGWYLPSANTLGVATNGVQRGTISSAGNWTIAPPTSGYALYVNGVAGSTPLFITSNTGATTTAIDLTINRAAGSTINTIAQGPNLQLIDGGSGGAQTILQCSGGQTELWQYNGSWNQILKVLSTRGVTINAPASGVALEVNSATGQGIDINGPSGYSSFNTYSLAGTVSGFVGIAGVANGGVTGSAVGDMWIRTVSGAISFTTNNGTSIALSLSAAGALSLPLVATTTTAPAAGSAGALPATPAGYMAVTIAGTARRIPYYT